MDFSNKRILFFANKLFSIQENIKIYLESKGAIVEYYDERPSNTALVKAAIRINRNLIGKYIDHYHSSIISKTKDSHFDFIFFIKGESFSLPNLKKLRQLHPESTLIVYHWDSIANNHNALNLLPVFDFKFSFDRQDCQKFNLEFLPLFFYDNYSSLIEIAPRFKYDLMFVGTTHSDRYRIVQSVAKEFSDSGKSCFIYYYFQNRMMFYKYILQNKDARRIDKDSVHFESLSNSRLLELYGDSRIIIDVNHPRQTGLTLRCIETLGAHRKLITTNKDIVNYDFYDPQNICVIDRNAPAIPQDFINSPYKAIPEAIICKYSLSNWINTIFSVTQ